LRDFLARHNIPYQWLDIESGEREPEVKRLVESLDGVEHKLPIVLFSDGTRLDQPTSAELADKLGLHTRAETDFYDLLIVGGGPAGLAAAVYGASEGLRTVMVEREAPGGQAGLSSRIENYLGFPSGLSGNDLARRAVAQARRFGVEILAPQEVTAVRLDGPYRFVKLTSGAEISCHALMIATGVQWRRLAVPGAERLLDAGVYYGAASTEALSCKGEDVYIVGGANSAGQAAMNFARYAARVIMLVAILDRSDQADPEHSDRVQYDGGGTTRRGAIGGHHASLRLYRYNGYGTGASAVHLHRRHATHRLAGRDCGAR
jgi:thioredoxin reductase (NADPH)